MIENNAKHGMVKEFNSGAQIIENYNYKITQNTAARPAEVQ